MCLQYLWHTDNWCITLEEPQLKALHGKKLKINVRLGEQWQLDFCPAHPVAMTCPAGSQQKPKTPTDCSGIAMAAFCLHLQQMRRMV